MSVDGNVSDCIHLASLTSAATSWNKDVLSSAQSSAYKNDQCINLFVGLDSSDFIRVSKVQADREIYIIYINYYKSRRNYV